MDRFRNTRLPDWDWWGKLWPTPTATLRRLGIEAGDSVVEIGSGNGYFALPAARITDPAPVYALELDQGLLNELSHLAAQHGIENVEPIRGDARSIADHLPEPVDVALLANALHGVDEPAPLVRSIASILAEDGLFIVVNWHDRPPEETSVDGEPRGPPRAIRLTADETRTIAADASDFDRVRRIELPPHHYALVFTRSTASAD